MIIFDLDGPILDVSNRYYKAYVDSLKEMGSEVVSKKKYWDLKRSRVSDHDILGRTSSEHLLDEFKIKRDRLIEAKELLKFDCVWPELRETYQTLFNQTSTILVTLRTYSERTSWQLKNLGIYCWFDSIVSHPSSENSKERWQIKADLVRRLGILNNVSCQQHIFVGDTETDILAGKNLGMKIIAVSFGIRAKYLLLPLKPDLIFDTPMELSAYLRREYL